MNAQARLLDLPMAGVYPVAVAEANALLVQWEHRLGPCNRPFRQKAYALWMVAVVCGRVLVVPNFPMSPPQPPTVPTAKPPRTSGNRLFTGSSGPA